MEDSYPYLPALENIKTSEREFWLMSAVFVPSVLVMGSTLGYLGFKYKEYLDNKTIILLAIIMASILYLIIRMLLSYVSFKTDANGLTMRGVLSKKHLRWEEITSVWNSTSKLSAAKCLCVKTSRRTYKLTMNNILSAALIIASVRQYLMPFGRANEIELDNKAKSLWVPIPDDIPEVISFGKAPSIRDKAFAWMVTLFVFSFILFFIYFSITDSSGLKIIGPSLLFAYFFLFKIIWAETMLKAKSLKIDSFGLEAQCFAGQVNITWDDISCTQWVKHYLLIYTENPKKTLGIEFVAGDKESESLIKAIIRNLRRSRNPQAVIIPQMVSVNLEMLKRPAYTAEGQIQMQRAYVNSLDEPARSKISRLRNIHFASLFCIMMVGALLSFSPILQDSIKYIQNGYAADVHFFFAPMTLIFCVPIFILFALSFEIGSRICKRFATPYEKEWDEMVSVGSSSKKVKRWMYSIFALIGIVSVVCMLLSFNCFFKVSDNNIVIGRFGSFKKEVYNWNEVRSITYRVKYIYNHGNTRSNDTYIITFSNGNKWKNNDSSSILSGEKEMPQAISFISKKSKVLITYMYE